MTPVERDRIRRILLEALPADARWVPWVEGVLDRIEQETPTEGVYLTRGEAKTALGWYADAWTDEVQPARYDRDLAQKLGEVLS